MRSSMLCSSMIAAALASTATAQQFELLTGVDAGLYPAVARSIPGDNGLGNYPDFYDGDRLAGTSDVGPPVVFLGSGTPIYAPNEFGSLSFIFRRGTLPFGGFFPLMGIEFLGGPRLDLDGDPNDPRSLIPIQSGAVTPAELSGLTSFIELEFDFTGGTVSLVNIDALATNETGPGQSPLAAVAQLALAGTATDGTLGAPINPGIDTRSGTLTAETGTSGTLTGVFAISQLGFEFWEDSIDPGSSSPNDLGTFQMLGELNGWVVRRDPNSGTFPTLAGEGLTTGWPAISTATGTMIATATGPAPFATITNAAGTDVYDGPDNGGLALTDFGGDLGAYLDAVVVPNLPVDATSFVYLESAGFGANNAFDPVFGDTIGYDLVLIAAATDACGTQLIGDSNCDGSVDAFDIGAFILALTDPAAWSQAFSCDTLCVNDTNGDQAVDAFDIGAFIDILTAP